MSAKATFVFEKLAGSKKKNFMSEGKKDIISGLAAGAVTTGATFPLDTMTTAAQSGYAADLKKSLGKTLTFKTVLKNPKLIPHLYKGIQYKWSKTIPGTAISLATYAGTRRFLDKKFPKQ